MKRVLFLSLSGIGNYLMQSPAIALLKRAHPDWHITVWVAPRGTRPLAEADPNIDEVIEMPKQGSVRDHLGRIQRLRQKKYDIGIVLSPGQLLKSAIYLYLAGIPRRVSNSYPLGKNPTSRFLLTDAVSEDETLHDIEQNLKLLEPLRIWNPESGIRNYTLLIPEKNKQQAQELLKKLAIPQNKLLVGIHAGSAPGMAFKRWPLERFAEVAFELIQKHNAHVLLFGGPDEAEQKDHLKQLIGPRAHVSIISASLLTTAAILQHCRLLISNDSGLMHLAAAAGVVTIGLFGPTDEKKTGPRGVHSSTIRAPGTSAVYNTETNINLGSEPHTSMLAITPQMVLDTILRIVG